MALSKDQIFGASDRKVEVVPVPEWGGDVILKTISGTDRDAFEDSLSTVDEDGNYQPNILNADARLLVKCIVDEDGNRVFSDGDADSLGSKSAPVLARLARKARELNSIGLDVKAAVDEAGKDSEPDPAEDSTSD
jgi:hypothetical protein